MVPESGSYKILEGYPYEPNSNSQLRFTVAIDKEPSSPLPIPPPGGTFLGEMEIDYVKIWQRNPNNGWVDLNAIPTITVNGPDIVCSTATFTAVNPTTTGYWGVNGANLQILSSNSSSVTVKVLDQSRTIGGVIYYPNNSILYPPLAGGMPYFISKTFDAGVSAASKAIISQTILPTSGAPKYKYNLSVKGGYPFGPGGYKFSNYMSPTTFHWSIDYGPALAYHYEADGQTISTPAISYTTGITNYMNWTVTITNACGSVTLNGSETFLNKKSVGTRSASNGHVVVVADVTDEAAYEAAVSARLQNKFFPEGSDTLTLLTGLEEIKLEELAPYILWDSTQTQQLQQRGVAPGTTQEAAPVVLETQLFPNPAKGTVRLLPGSNFSDTEPVSFILTDQLGRTVFSHEVYYQSGTAATVDISQLAGGLYYATMKQNSTEEHTRLVIQDK